MLRQGPEHQPRPITLSFYPQSLRLGGRFWRLFPNFFRRGWVTRRLVVVRAELGSPAPEQVGQRPARFQCTGWMIAVGFTTVVGFATRRRISGYMAVAIVNAATFW